MFDIYEDIPVGIDLGTTYSCIGYWNGKEVNIVPNRMGERTTSSVIYFKINYLLGKKFKKICIYLLIRKNIFFKKNYRTRL